MRPFRPGKIKAPVVKNAFASTRYVHQYVQHVLSMLHFSTGKGGQVSEKADGNIHFEFVNTGLGSGAFAVEASGGTATIAPGLIYSPSGSGNPWMTPQIGGVPLDHDPAPSIGYNPSGTGYLVITATFSRVTGYATGTPWQIHAKSSPVSIPLIREQGSSIAGQDGVLDIPICKIVNGVVTIQNLSAALTVYSSYNQIVVGQF